MISFSYSLPTDIVFGKETQHQVGKLIRQGGHKRVLLHYGETNPRKRELIEAIHDSLKRECIEYIDLGGVVPNPRLGLARKGVTICKQNGVDFILALGGGSVIDSAKAIALGAVTTDDIWDFFNGSSRPKRALPVGCIVTIAAAGSETSSVTVITNEIEMFKRMYSSRFIRCSFAILNPELTFTLPYYQTASGGVDSLMHTVERYFTANNPMQVTDRIAEGVMKTIMENTQRLREEPTNYEARAELLWCSNIAHNGITGCGSGPGDWASHLLEHELAGLCDVAHGAGLAAIWGSWARFVFKANSHRFACFAERVMGIDRERRNDEELALAGIEAMELFFKAIGMPNKISDMGIELTDLQIRRMAQNLVWNGPVGDFKKIGSEDAIQIYSMAK